MQARKRNRASAKKAGTRFETQVAKFLNQHLPGGIERRAKTGAKDRGDIAGLNHPATGAALAVECKNTRTTSLADWARQAETERINAGAAGWIICHKRHGSDQPEQQWVTCTLAQLVTLLTGTPAQETTEKKGDTK